MVTDRRAEGLFVREHDGDEPEGHKEVGGVAVGLCDDRGMCETSYICAETAAGGVIGDRV